MTLLEIQEHIKQDFPHLKKLSASHENYADYRLVQFATQAMEEKLKISRDKGRHGWWDESVCSIQDLQNLLEEHVTKGDMVDVMNIAAMIYVRQCAEETICTPKETIHQVKFSMNGFRSNLHNDLKELKQLVCDVINDEYVDKDELEEAMVKIICASNGLNCVFIKGNDLFNNMENLFLSPICEDEVDS